MGTSQLTSGEAMTADEHDPKPGKMSKMSDRPEHQLSTMYLNAYLQLYGWQAVRRLWSGYWVWRIERIGEEKSL
jgi:hypothetical protein